ncbi:MAG TPA: UDP-N-acetylmuramate dehydrogenase [bacterium]|nr:UDP-N-acetylmuramate dehydrogenase [bacterium]
MYCVFLPIDGGSSSRWQDRIEGSVAEGVALARHTTYRVGGPAKYFVVPATADDVREVFASSEDTFVLGAGSNVLVADAGFDGVVLKVCNTMAHISAHDGEVVVGAGRLLPSLVNSCVEMGLSGMEWAVGVPGTVGGAVCTNAGAFGSATWDYVDYVEVMTAEGSRRRLAEADVEHGYRFADLAVAKPFAVTEVAFRLTSSDAGRVRALTEEYRTRRGATQPVGAASAGSVFKNPPQGPSAGELIDKAGLKGLTRGEAVVSPKHANFIVNEGGATAADIYGLIEEVREKVRAEFGLTLELEIRLVGDFDRG